MSEKNEKTLAVISQPRFMPALNYLHRMEVADLFIYLDNVRYTARDWENRNKIKTPEGPQWISVPVKRIDQDMRICDTFIDNEQNWPRKIIGSLKQNYGHAPYFKDYMPFFEDCLTQRWERLIDLNAHIVDYACRCLDIQCDFVRASELGIESTGETLLMDICKKLNVDIYISGPHGRAYLQKKNWEKAGIDLVFHDYIYPVYPQQYGEFIPWISFLDLLMNCGTRSRQLMLSKNTYFGNFMSFRTQ